MKLRSYVSLTRLIISLLFIVGMILFSFSDIRSGLVIKRMSSETVNYLDTPEQVDDIKPVEPIKAPGTKDIVSEGSQSEEALGYLSIPDLGINEPIYKNTTNETLLLGVSSLYPRRDPEEDNIVIFGHHLGYYGYLFGQLNNAQKGMPVSLMYLGESYEYEVYERAIVPETRVDLVDNRHEQPYLTLVTCDSPDYTDQRTVVTAKLIKSEKLDPNAYKNKRTALSNQRQDNLKFIMNDLNKKLVILTIEIIVGLLIINTLLIRRKK